ncbi:hypothetical protein SAMN05444375_12711 [Segatella baroniae B14]|nr:hypothetical protein SAMN05444375_12711 [Segatella baroniae B14]
MFCTMGHNTDSFDGINTCKVYYSKGLFGWLVVDRITR